ncbi:Ig-like domain-containing protein [bacterium]|nr:Ig-like domain-containing protein [bacterium]
MLIHTFSETNLPFGNSVSGAGDVDNDGYDDIIIGEMGNRDLFNGSVSAGAAYVYSGNPLLNYPKIHTFNGRALGECFGNSVSGAGDVDNDGYDDVIVGAPFANQINLWRSTGSAYVYSGRNGNLLHQWDGEYGYDFFGGSVSGVGDVNGDGFDDLIVGAPFHGYDVYDVYYAGAAYVYSGKDGSLLYKWSGESDYHCFGSSVSGGGDVNDDGNPDIIVGAPSLASLATPLIGSAFVYSGSHFNGAPIALNDNVSTFYDLQVTIDVLSNDTDPEGDPLTVVSANTPPNGSAIIIGDQVVYTPDAGWMGTDSFLYFIEDTDGNTANATITVEVTRPSYTITNFIAGNYATFHISGASPNSSVTIGYSLAGSGPTTTAFGIVDMSAPIKSMVSLPADSSGNAWFSPLVPAGTAGITFYTQAKCGNLLSNSLALIVQ